MSAAQSDHREHFRLRYPESARPLLRCANQGFVVTEISEGGMRLHLADAGNLFDEERAVAGSLLLPSGVIGIIGRPLRLDDDELVLLLERGPSLHVMFEEQKRLIRAFPGLYGKDD